MARWRDLKNYETISFFTDRADFRRELAGEVLLDHEEILGSWLRAGGGVLAEGLCVWDHESANAVLYCAESAIWIGEQQAGSKPPVRAYVDVGTGEIERHKWPSNPSLERAAAFAFLAHSRAYLDEGVGEVQRLAEAALDEFGGHAQVTGSADGMAVVSILRNLILQLPAGRAVPTAESVSRRLLLRHLFVLRIYAEGVTGVHAPALPWALELLEGTLARTSGDKVQIEQIRGVLARALTHELERSAAPYWTKLALVHLRLAKAAFASGETEPAAQHHAHAAALVGEHDLLTVSGQGDEIQEWLREVGQLVA